MKIQFQILGNPQAQKRHKHAVRGKYAHIYDPSEEPKRNFLLAIQQNAPKPPILSEVHIKVWFYMPRPKSHYRTGKYAGILKDNIPIWHTKKPDIDNCIKFCTDSMNGIFWKDDSQIVEITAHKTYSETPRTVIEIVYGS